MLTILLDNGRGSNTIGRKSPKINFDLPDDKQINTTDTPKKDTSIIDSVLCEYQFNRRVMGAVMPRLQALGFNAINIVPEINDVSISGRIYRVNQQVKRNGEDNCILISIHTNMHGTGRWLKHRGWTVVAPETKNESDKLANSLYDVAEQYFNDDTELVESFKDSKYAIVNKILYKEVNKAKGYENALAVVEGSKCPAVLIENFYLDNKDDIKYIESSDGFRRICDVIVDGVVDYATKHKGYRKNI